MQTVWNSKDPPGIGEGDKSEVGSLQLFKVEEALVFKSITRVEECLQNFKKKVFWLSLFGNAGSFLHIYFPLNLFLFACVAFCLSYGCFSSKIFGGVYVNLRGVLKAGQKYYQLMFVFSLYGDMSGQFPNKVPIAQSVWTAVAKYNQLSSF